MNLFRLLNLQGASTKKLTTLIVVCCVFMLKACYYDNVEDLYPSVCNTTEVTYSGFVRPFVDAGCSCHVDGSRNGNINLDTYNDMKLTIQNGSFLNVIKHTTGYVPMPPSVPKRSACEISKLEAWINAGAKEN